jgi:hypothetical protein
MATLPAVRVEDASSIGRSYSSSASTKPIPGLGLKRSQLASKTLGPADGDLTLESMSMQRVHLSRATREQVLAYFRNTWELTTTLFTALRTDAAFYATPDVLRRRLVFYFGHPAALYANKLHQVGLVGE